MKKIIKMRRRVSGEGGKEVSYTSYFSISFIPEPPIYFIHYSFPILAYI